MKKYFGLFMIVVGGLVFMTSCKKSGKYEAKPLPVDNNAYLRIVHVAPNFRTVLQKPDSFHIYQGDMKVNGPQVTYNTFFPVSTANVNTYAAIAAGNSKLRFSLIGKNLVDSQTIITLPVALGKGTYYTLFITDNIRDGQTAPQILSQDFVGRPDTGKYALRFAHMILSDTAGKTVDVYSYRQAVNIFSAVTPGSVTAFATLPYIAPSLDTFSIRRTGTGQELVRLNGVSISNNRRVYTIVYRGTSGTTGTKPRGAVVINNR
jgi:hypothetical protein